MVAGVSFPSLKMLTDVADLVTEKRELILFGVVVEMVDCGAPCFAGLVLAGLLTATALFTLSTAGLLVMNGLLFSSLPSTAIERRFARVCTPVFSAGRTWSD